MTEVHETDQTFEEWPGAGVKTLLPPSRMCDLGRVSPSLWQILGLHDGSQLSLRPPEEPLRDSADKDMWQVHGHHGKVSSPQHANLASLLEMKQTSWIVSGDFLQCDLPFPVLKGSWGPW